MTNYTIFDVASGAVISNLTVISYDEALLNIDEINQTLVEGTYSPDEWRLENGNVVSISPRPAPYFTFDYSLKEWVDKRTQQEYDDYVASIRGAAKISKREFLMELKRGGAFGYSDIVDLGVGYFPQSVLDALTSWTAEQILDAQLEWISSTTVSRLDPLITAVETYLGTFPSDTDLLFGITLYPPPENP